MELSAFPENLLTRLQEFVTQQLGLHFPPNRWPDLRRGLAAAFEELGFADLTAGAECLLSAPPTTAQLDVLATHLTIGETYFFREKATFKALAAEVLPQLIDVRRKRQRRLRIWSAACCTGEEAYSIAILLRQVLPDLADWFVTIMATDINARFLQKAAAGVYGEWSFRETPTSWKDRYFTRTDDGCYAILPEIKKQVTFTQLNLVRDVVPSLVAETNAMDLIFCRNVLMYFSPAQTQKVVHNLYRALVPDGWLVVSPSETSQTVFARFVSVNRPGVILYQKSHAQGDREQSWSLSVASAGSTAIPAVFAPLSPADPPTPSLSTTFETDPSLGPLLRITAQQELHAIAETLYNCGEYAEAVETLLSSCDASALSNSKQISILTRALANQGKLTEALAWDDRWIAADKLDPAGHYLRAVILQELGESQLVRRSLQTVLYLDPGFVLAHFALGNLARRKGMTAEANRHFANASALLGDYQAADVLPESDGLTAGRLGEIITSISSLEVAP